MQQGDEATGDTIVIDQPLEVIDTQTFDDVWSYGQERIATVLDQALELGAPKDVIEEARRLVDSVANEAAWQPPTRIRDWGRNPDETYKMQDEVEILNRYKTVYPEKKKNLRDFFKENFLSAEQLAGTYNFTVTVPIFVIASPQTQKSKVSMCLTTEKKGSGGFELKVFGNGLGSDTTSKVVVAEEHTCEDGLGRRADLEVPLLAVPIGFELSTGPKVLWWNVVKDDSKPGELIVADCKGRKLDALAGSRDGDDLNLVDVSGLTKVQRSVEKGRDLDYSLGATKGSDVTAKIKVSVKTSQEIKLAFELPGGCRYRYFQPIQGVGGMCRVVR
jgi:hypothetical protein